MASPQLEKGYTRIANEMLQALSQARLTGNEWSVLFIVMRMTWGYQVKRKKITYGFIAKHTALSKRTVIRSVKSLNNKVILGLIREKGAKAVNEMWINKDYALWKGVTPDTVKGVTVVTLKGVTVVTLKGVTPDTTYKEIKKEIIKKKIDDFRNKNWKGTIN